MNVTKIVVYTDIFLSDYDLKNHNWIHMIIGPLENKHDEFVHHHVMYETI